MKPLFELGEIRLTSGAFEATEERGRVDLLYRHMTGDFGSVHAEDKAINNEAIRTGGRVLSAYPIDPAKPSAGFGENTVWIITEEDRSATTILLPDEY